MSESGNFYRDSVLSGIEPINTLYESEQVIAFEHTRPSYTTHYVVIPKSEVDSLLDLPTDGDLLRELILAIQHVARDVMNLHGKCRVVTNLGEYQDSKHLHWHVISADRIDTANSRRSSCREAKK